MDGILILKCLANPVPMCRFKRQRNGIFIFFFFSIIANASSGCVKKSSQLGCASTTGGDNRVQCKCARADRSRVASCQCALAPSNINEVRYGSAVNGRRLTLPDISTPADLQVVEQRVRDVLNKTASARRWRRPNTSPTPTAHLSDW